MGIVGLNLLLPGLGLLRLGRARAGLGWWGLFLGASLILIGIYALVSDLDFIGLVALMAFVLLPALAAYPASMVHSWRSSVRKMGPGPWWTRWYALTGLVLCNLLLGELMSPAHRYYRNFYAASESMAPTIDGGDRMFANMRPVSPVRRGQVLLIEDGRGLIRIYRVAGLPGDRVQIRRGVPIINGRPAVQKLAADRQNAGARRLEERLPGETGSHFILDSGYSPEMDEMPPRRVPPARLFVLGDNRDRAADSRVPPDRNGVDLPQLADVRGRPIFFIWHVAPSKIGKPI